MPRRLVPLINNQYYHIFNRGVEKRHVFITKRDNQRFLDTCLYYQSKKQIKFSNFLKLSNEQRSAITDQYTDKNHLVSIISYCLMPNHFHFILQQKKDGGISFYMRHIIDSYTRFFNKRNERTGPLFQGTFKAVRIEDDEQLLHLSRYIHLNPFTSYLVAKVDDLPRYQWSSLSEYLDKAVICDPEIILSAFKSPHEYLKFVYDQSAYQRKLGNIKHLILE